MRLVTLTVGKAADCSFEMGAALGLRICPRGFVCVQNHAHGSKER